jgi:ferredoxin
MTLNVQIDEGACLGHGDCVHAAPGVFELNGDIAEVVAPGTDEQLRAAARACPAGAILLFDAATNEEVDP